MQVRDCADSSDEAAALCGEIATSRPEAVSCILPPYPEHGAYATDIAGAKPGQGYERVSLSITCERGYDARGVTSREFSCSHGVWTGSVPRCV
ncbi:Pattern recognition serine proteinase, partial [Operophtera brumata]